MTGPVNGFAPPPPDDPTEARIRQNVTARMAGRSLCRHLDAANAALAAALDDFRDLARGEGGDGSAPVLAGAAVGVVAGVDAARKALYLVEWADCLMGRLRERMGDDPIVAVPAALSDEVKIKPFGRLPLAVHLDAALRARVATGMPWADRYLDKAIDAAASRLPGAHRIDAVEEAEVMQCLAPGCGREIHPERLLASPHSVTCSHECSQARAAELRRINAERWRLRRARDPRHAAPGSPAVAPGAGGPGAARPFEKGATVACFAPG